MKTQSTELRAQSASQVAPVRMLRVLRDWSKSAIGGRAERSVVQLAGFADTSIREVAGAHPFGKWLNISVVGDVAGLIVVDFVAAHQ